MQLKGRHWVIGWLALFLVVTTIVVARQLASLRTARTLAALQEERTALEAQLADLERRVRDARSRKVLVPKAESLGLHMPSDSEFTRLMLPPAGSPPPSGGVRRP